MRPKFGKNLFSTFLLFSLLSFFLMLLDGEGILRPVRGQVEKLIVPAKTKIYQLQLKNEKTEKLKDKGEEERKIAELEAQIANLKEENAATRRLLGAPLPATWRFAPAQVIGSSSRQTLEIDKGRQDGFKEGMVVVFENVLVGKIVQTGEFFSKISSPFAETSKILAFSRKENGQAKAKGLLIGQGESLSFERVLPQETLENEDLILTLGDEVFPANLLLGKVTKVSKKEGEIYQKAQVGPLLEFDSLETVFVIIGR